MKKYYKYKNMFFAIVLGFVNLGGKKHQDRDISEKKQNLFYTM